MAKVLIIGAGGVGTVVAHKVAKAPTGVYRHPAGKPYKIKV